MWKVYVDEQLIYDTKLETLNIFNAKLNLELNKTGAFTFTIYPSHPYYSRIERLKPIIKVYQNGILKFRGRLLDDDSGFHNQKYCVCEGELAFFNDTIQRYEAQTTSISDFFAVLIEAHNLQVEEEKRFIMGVVGLEKDEITIEDAKHCTTWEALNNELINKHGGYLWIRHEADGNYIDYLEDFTTLSSQSIEFGKNLLDFNKTIKGSEIATAIIPLGKDDLTIEDVNDGLDYLVNEEAVAKYGYIYKVVEFSDIEDATELKTEGEKYLANVINLVVSLELSAIDLASVDKNFSSFSLGSYVSVYSTPHGENSNFLITKLSIDLLQPKNNKLTLGKTYSSFTEKAQTSNTAQKEIINSIKGNVQMEDLNNAIQETTELNSSNISQSADEILLKVSEDYFLKDEANTLIESVNTTIRQTNEEVEIRFNQFNQNIEDVINETDAQFQEISKYIRFVDGNIILGEEGNELVLKIENDRIAFLQSNVEVAYFSNRKLFVLDGEFIESLKLGKFAFLPRSNGNLSFKKVE